MVLRPYISFSTRPLLDLLPLTLLGLVVVVSESHLLPLLLQELLINLITIILVLASSARLISLNFIVLFVVPQFLAPFKLPFTFVVKFYLAAKNPLKFNFRPAPVLVVITDGLLAGLAEMSLKVSLLHKDFLELSKIHFLITKCKTIGNFHMDS